MNHLPATVFSAVLALCCTPSWANDPPATTTTLTPVTVHASDTQVMTAPSVHVRVTGQQLQVQNIVDSSDALKFTPNMQVRKRYPGDPNAVISGRNTGTLQSARSLVYADGLLLSNLMTNGWDGAPRWGMVAPQEIGAVDVLYGPYSALYPGNSIGTSVLIHTLLPQRLVASASAQYFSQDFHDAYGTSGTYNGHQLAASLGNRQGRWSWLLALDRLDSHGQPMQYASAQRGGNPGNAVAVTGAVNDRNPTGSPRLVYGANSIEHTVQTQGKLKLGVDLGADVAALFTVGWWHNRADDHTRSALRDAAGNPVTGGVVDSGGTIWTLPPSGLAPTAARDNQMLYGTELNGHTTSGWHWTAVASRYDLTRALLATANGPAANEAGAQPGSVADRHGSGWDTLDLRSSGPIGAQHTLYLGSHLDRYILDTTVRAARDWRGPADGAVISVFAGRTQTRALYVQDAWDFAPDWTLTMGLRIEQWRAYAGRLGNAGTLLHYADRQRTDASPKAVLNWDLADGWELRLSRARAVRYPTVAELFQGTLSGNNIVNNNPRLQPEVDESADLTLRHQVAHGHWRVSLFQDRIANSLYAQTDITVTPTVTNVQNIDLVRSRGIEGAIDLTDVWTPGLDIQASIALNQPRTVRDRQYAPAEGKWFPRIPRVRASVLADYHFAPGWDASLGMRHSGRQYSTLNNADFVDTYGAVSSFTVADAKLRWQFAEHWTASLGVDNLTNAAYWVYHPYPGRIWLGELRWQL